MFKFLYVRVNVTVRYLKRPWTICHYHTERAAMQRQGHCKVNQQCRRQGDTRSQDRNMDNKEQRWPFRPGNRDTKMHSDLKTDLMSRNPSRKMMGLAKRATRKGDRCYDLEPSQQSSMCFLQYCLTILYNTHFIILGNA